MNKAICLVFSCFLTSGVWAQHIASVDGKPLSAKEFLWVYKKNHAGGANTTLKELESYLNLYINFKLKALDARDSGLEDSPEYLSEVKNYEQALLTQKKIGKGQKEFGLIMAEYRDAVLMFTLSEEKIWKKSQSDTPALLDFYYKNLEKYQSKPFDETKPAVILDYQEYLEKQWIDSLWTKYKVVINHNELKKLAKRN